MDINPDSERSSYLSASLWGPCSLDMVLLEVGPPSSISSFKVDGRPGHKHNYILVLWIVFEYQTGNDCREDKQT